MKIILSLSCLVSISTTAPAQVQMLRFITSSTGYSAQVNQTLIQYTLGEVAVSSLQNQNFLLTQGFQQPEVTQGNPFTEPVLVKDFIVFPNPAVNQTKLEFDLIADSRVNIQLVNNAGQTIRNIAIDMLAGKINYPLSLGGLAAGLYYVVVQAGNRNYSEKLDNRVVTSGASFLLLSPDARSAGVGEAGTGLSADANSIFLNPAKLVFADQMGFSLSYTPWMRELTKDAQLGYLSAYRKLNDLEVIGISVKYLNLGTINFRDESGNLLQEYKANEFSLDATYARKFGETFSMALTGRFFRSDLGSGTYNNLLLKRTSAFAADISIYSQRDLQSTNTTRGFSWGLCLSNIGTKLKYSEQESTFLPMNLRIGAGYTLYSEPGNRLTLLADVNKLMVPTPPIYKRDENGNLTSEIEKGKDPNRSVPSALFTSLFDAPGGFKEELSEFAVSAGLEFSYAEQFFIRSGYLYEDPKKGNRQHFAAGLGFRISPLNVDVSYVFPTSDRYVLRNTMRITLSYSPGSGLSGKK
eukprot:gene14718-17395_t